MKKIYALLTLLGLFLFGGVVPTAAQNEVSLSINGKTGTWVAVGSPVYASEYATASENPGVHIQHWARNGDHRNNMWFWDGNNLSIYSAFGSTESEDYRIIPSAGWYVKKVSFDFVTGVHPNFANPAGIQVYVNGDEPVVSEGTEDLQHYEIDDLDPELPYAVLTIAQVDKPAFANTSNFTITLKKQEALVAAWAEFTAAFDKYSAMSADDFPVGTEPGCYDEAAVTAFFDAIDAAAGIDNEDPENITVEMLNAATKKMNDAYEAMIASKVVYQVANGYYRFRTGMQYNDGNPKYLACLPSSTAGTYVGYWYTPTDAEDNYINIFKVAKSGDNYDIMNVAYSTRFSGPTATSGQALLTTTSTELVAIDGVSAEYVNMRLASKDANATFYFHQGSHNAGAGTQGYVVGWSTSYSNGTPGPTEWVLEPVSDSEVESARMEYEAFKAHQQLVNDYNSLLSTAAAELPKTQDGCEGDALITDAEQFSSPFSDSQEGLDFGALIDDNPATYWHSDWHAGNQPNHSHYLQVDLSQAEYTLARLTITRRPVANDHVTVWGVYGSNDPEAADEDWTQLIKLYTPFGNNTETLSGLVFDGKGYKYLRFYIDGTTNNRGYGHASFFQLYAVESLDGTVYASIGETAAQLADVIAAQQNLTSDELTQEHFDALKSAYDAFHAKFSDPTEMRNLIKQAEEFAAGIVTGDNPGQWSDDSSVNALNGTIVAAKLYDETGNYDPAKTADFVSTLTAQMETIKAAANPVKPDTWYRFRFGTQEEFIEGGWDLVAGDGTDTDAELWGKYVAVGQYDGSAVEPIDLMNVRMGTRLFFLDSSDISDEDMSLFRFVECGDKGYMLQNKATGLFLKAAGTSGSVTLSIIPSFFTTSALGYGQNLIAAKDMAGNAQSYLHAQVSQNTLVTWNATNVGSRSGLYIEEVGSASGFDGSEFAMDIMPGRFYSFCYPVDLSTTEGKMLTVSSAEGTTVNLTTVNQAAAGEPFIYLFGELSDYSADNSPEVVVFKHGMDIADEPKTDGAIKGTYVAKKVGAGFILVDANNPTIMSVTRDLLGDAVDAYSAYIQSTESLPYSADITVVIDGETVIDGVHDLSATLNSVYRKGEIFTLDGRRVSSNGNIDDARRLGRGIYIINGVKVAVK